MDDDQGVHVSILKDTRFALAWMGKVSTGVLVGKFHQRFGLTRVLSRGILWALTLPRATLCRTRHDRTSIATP